MEKNQKRIKWRNIVNEFKKSGKSVPKWCESNGIKVHNLRYWLKKFNDETLITKSECQKETTEWVTVNTAEMNSKINKSPLKITIGKASIEVNNEFDPNLLKDVIKALSGLC